VPENQTKRGIGMTPEVVAGVDSRVAMQAVPVELYKVQLMDGHGQRVEGYALVDDNEVRLIEPRAIGRPLQGWAEKAIRSRVKRMKAAGAQGADATQADPKDIG
jgi:hypothetical protein